MQNKQSSDSREIPRPIKRIVRQRCGFGCVICGKPLYEYDHIIDWAVTKKHRAEEITLLCDQHHKEKTNGLLPKAAIAAANLDPHNLRQGVSKLYLLHYTGDEVKVVIGTNTFHGARRDGEIRSIPLIIDGVPLIELSTQGECLFLNLVLFDKDNNTILIIIDNELVYVPDPWDIQFVKRKLTIRQAHGNILMEFQFNPPDEIVVTRGIAYCNGIKVLIKKKQVEFPWNGAVIGNNEIYGAVYGIVIGDQSTINDIIVLHSRFAVDYPKDKKRTIYNAFDLNFGKKGKEGKAK